MECSNAAYRDMQIVTTFLSEIGLPWRFVPGASGFIAGIDIADGALLIDPEVARVSGVLHEAGHLCTLAAEVRPHAQTDVSGAQSLALSLIDPAKPDGPYERAALQCSDPEATAWAWAAGMHLQLAPEVVIQDDEYDGTGADIRFGLAARQYAGINGLAFAGFCAVRPGLYATATGQPVYPRLARWMQPDFGRRAVG